MRSVKPSVGTVVRFLSVGRYGREFKTERSRSVDLRPACGRHGKTKKSRSVDTRPARAVTVSWYGRYGNPKRSKSVHVRPARVLTVGRFGWYGRSLTVGFEDKTS